MIHASIVTARFKGNVTKWQQESLANAKVSARQRYVYGGPWRRNLQANQRKEHEAEKYIQRVTTPSLTIRVNLHSFSCCCVPNLQNPTKFSEKSNLYSSRSSKVIGLDVKRKRGYNFLLVMSSNFGRISYSFRDIEACVFKIACFSHHTLVLRHLAEEGLSIST